MTRDRARRAPERALFGMEGREILLIEETHGVAAELQELGLVVERHAHRAVNTGITNRVSRNIKESRDVAV